MTMVEVLVTVVILTMGLLPLLQLQTRVQLAGLESYQRAQALVLLDDMASRLASNRRDAASYATTTGEGATCATSPTTPKDIDISEWCNALQGAGETTGTSKLGAMVGGRGCIEGIGNDEYLVTVAWQGLTPIAAPPDSVACGKGLYNGLIGSNGTTRSPCDNDLCRRTVTTLVRFATLN